MQDSRRQAEIRKEEEAKKQKRERERDMMRMKAAVEKEQELKLKREELRLIRQQEVFKSVVLWKRPNCGIRFLLVILSLGPKSHPSRSYFALSPKIDVWYCQN